MARHIASFELLGVKIRLDASWILLALLIAWSLAAGVFPQFYRGLPQFTYWGMAGATVIGVAVSIILHEMGHTLVARASGLPIRSITLFVFGGVAEMEGEPKAPKTELLMAVAGPLVSVALGVGFLSASTLFPAATLPEYHGVLHYLGVLNFALAAFNMAPAFPMDGGRVLRALIWMFTGDADRATRVAARAGELVGMLLMALGAITALATGLVTGLWWVIIGWFIFSMARAHGIQVEAKRLLAGAKVMDLMTPNPITAPADISVQEFIDTILARFPHDLIPVVSDGRAVGGAGFKEAQATPRETWRDVRLGDIATPIAGIPTAAQHEPIEAALERLQRAQASRLLVLTEAGTPAGVLTLKDLASHLRFRSEFAGGR